MSNLKLLACTSCFLIMALGVISCGGKGNVTSTPSITFTEAPPMTQIATPPATLDYLTSPLYVLANPNKSTYLSGEEVKIEFSIKNEGALPIQISPIPPTIEIKELFESGYSGLVRLFVPGTGLESLNPGARFSFNLTWDQRDKAGQLVEPGHYIIMIKDINIQEIEGEYTVFSSENLGMFVIQ